MTTYDGRTYIAIMLVDKKYELEFLAGFSKGNDEKIRLRDNFVAAIPIAEDITMMQFNILSRGARRGLDHLSWELNY